VTKDKVTKYRKCSSMDNSTSYAVSRSSTLPVG
jgi:hypothetical protein